MGLAVRATCAASLGAGAQRLVDDRLDGARAAAALGTATETAINLLGIPGEIFRALDGITDIVVGKDVAGTNDHKSSGGSSVKRSFSILESMTGCKRKSGIFKLFQTAPDPT
jgi:hypothetical protein